MVVSKISREVMVGICLILLLASTAAAQIEDQLSSYSGANAEGYLGPLADAFGTDLNGGLFYSAHIPTSGKYFRGEFVIMSVLFSDEDRTFNATTESGFSPQTTAEAPTVVGPGKAETVMSPTGAKFTFPGGFDLSSAAFVAPQIRFGSYKGTEGLVRVLALDIGDVELGKVTLYGFGLRHNVSQYFGPDFYADIAAGFFYQSLKIGENKAGDDLMTGSALTFGVQASKRYFKGPVMFEPFAGLSLDRFSADISYESKSAGSPGQVDVDFGTDTSARFTLGLGLGFSFVKAHAQYAFASQNSFSLGLGFGN